jgi:hypothetical protein
MHLRIPLLRRSLAIGLAGLVVLGALGCGSDDSNSDATVAQPAKSAPASSDKLDPDSARTLSDAARTVAQYCNGHKATHGEVIAAVATVESLYDIDPAATQANGQSVEQAAGKLKTQLQGCGATSAAKRLAKLTG